MKTLVVLITIVVSSVRAEELCFNRLNRLSNPTAHFISYLTRLLDQRIVGDSELSHLIDEIKAGRDPNPFPADRLRTHSNVLVHREELQRQAKIIDRKQVLDWAESIVSKYEQVQVARSDVSEETKHVFQKMIFHPVKPGRTAIRHSFEMMSTPVTQQHWMEIMGSNPSAFVKGPDVATLEFNGRTYNLQPDNPVESVSVWSAMEFANRLSVRAGLTPAYDFSQVEFFSTTSAAKGNLARTTGLPFVIENIYETEGYRLPTQEEFLHVLKSDPHALSLGYDELTRFAWFNGNSNLKTHPVGELEPFYFDGHPFYDMLGNVWEWTVDPKRPDDSYITRGGAFNEFPFRVTADSWQKTASQTKHHVIGFRLVRTVK